MDSEKEKFGDIIKTLSPSSIEDELNKTKRHSQVTCTYIYIYNHPIYITSIAFTI
jgi:hypothetical protein